MKTININIKSSTPEVRIRNYLNTLYKFHRLTDKEIDILVEFILKYYEIVTKYPIHDAELIDKLLFDLEVKKKIRDKLGIKDSVFQNYMTTFRKKGVIKEKGLNPSYIPPKETFDLTFKFI